MNVNEVIISNPTMAIHLFAGFGVLFVGALQVFVIARGTKEHKTIGRIWVALMSIMVISSLWDFMQDGLISMPAQVFTAMTIILLPISIWAVRNQKIKLHKLTMFGAYFGVVIAAVIALIVVPGRLFNTWFF